MIAGIDTLVLGAFIASEKYASGKRQQAALKEKLENQPQGVFFDSTNKQKPIVHGNLNKKEGMVQIGTYNPKKGFGSTKLYPSEILSRIMPKPPELGKIAYYQSQKTFKQYSSVAALKQAEGANTSYRTMQFDQKSKEMGLPSEKIFDEKKSVKTQNPVYLSNDFKETSTKPTTGYRADKIIENGVTRYDIKETIKKEKVEKDKREVAEEKVETVYTIGGETGTIDELVAKRVITTEEGKDIETLGATPIGERNIKIYDDNSIDVGSFTSFNEATLKMIKPEFYKEKKEKTKYYANIINKTTGLPTTGYELTGDWKSEKRKLENRGYVVLDVYTKKDGKVTYETFEKNAKNSSVEDADAGAFTLASFKFEGPYGKAINIKAPKDVGKPDVRSSFLFQANNQVSGILMNSVYADLFYKDQKKVNKIAQGLESIILQEYTKEGVQGVPSLKFYIPLATGPNSFIDRYPALANMKVNVDGMRMSYAEYLQKKQAGQISRETLMKMIGIDYANKVNNLPSKTIGTKKNITAPNGSSLVYPILTTYTNASHRKAVESVLKLAKNQEEVDYYSNILQNKLTVYTDAVDPATGNLVPALNQPQLEFFNIINSKEFSRNLTVGGKQIPVKGFQMLKAVMNPKYTIDGASTANLFSQDYRVKLSNQIRTAGMGDLNKIADILDIALSRGAGADIDITLNNIHRFKRGEEQEGKDKLVAASADMAKATSQAIAEADQLEGTYFDAQGNLYPEGSGLAQLYLYVDDGLYTFGVLTDKAMGMINAALGRPATIKDAYSYNYEQVLGGALKRVNQFKSVYDNTETAEKYKGQEQAEQEARANNRERLETIVRQMNATKDGKADEKARNFARRNFHKYMLAYQLAAAIQGGTGGRTISDQDVQNILNAFNFTPFSKPQNELATIRAAKAMLRRLNTYHNAIASLAGVGGEDPQKKRRARLILEADKFLATSQGYSVQNLSKMNSGVTVANYIRDKGKAIGSDATGGGGLQPVSPELQKQFEFDLTNKVLKSLPS